MKQISIKNKYIILIIIVILLSFISLFLGSSKLSFIDCLNGLFTNNNETASIIIKNIRIPRILGAIVAGIGLSVSGVILQSITNNSLASPNIIGVNSGAGLVTIILLSFFPTLVYLLPIGAFIGAFLTTLLIIFLSNKISSSKGTIILAGMAITTLLNGIISFISLIDNDVLSTYKYFSIGGLNGITLNQLLIPIILIIISIIITLIIAPRIEILSLGNEVSKSLGINVNCIKILCMICASCLAASIVSYAGLLGFVGLIVPHIARKIVGGNIRNNITSSILIGSILVLAADTIGRVILYPTEIPVGIVMAFIGCPFFLYLLLRRKVYD